MSPRRARRRSIAIGLTLAAMLAGCPHNPERAAPETAMTPTADSAPAQTSDAHTVGIEQIHKPAPPKGGPLPPQRVFEPVQLDRSCQADADCVIKDIGSCCGAFPSCVNRDSPTDPAAVAAACEKTGPTAPCSRRVLEQCACRQGQCVAADKTPVGGLADDATSPPAPTR